MKSGTSSWDEAMLQSMSFNVILGEDPIKGPVFPDLLALLTGYSFDRFRHSLGQLSFPQAHGTPLMQMSDS